jgi:hypothetical protein
VWETFERRTCLHRKSTVMTRRGWKVNEVITPSETLKHKIITNSVDEIEAWCQWNQTGPDFLHINCSTCNMQYYWNWICDITVQFHICPTVFKCGILLCLIMSIQACKIKLLCGSVVFTILGLHVMNFFNSGKGVLAWHVSVGSTENLFLLNKIFMGHRKGKVL